MVAYQQAIVARDEEEASAVVHRVLRTLEKCQRRPKGYWLYGPTHTQRLGSEVSASWLGEVGGSLNTSGHAPKPERINGGVAVLQHGARVAVLSVNWCQRRRRRSLRCRRRGRRRTAHPAEPYCGAQARLS